MTSAVRIKIERDRIYLIIEYLFIQTNFFAQLPIIFQWPANSLIAILFIIIGDVHFTSIYRQVSYPFKSANT